MVSGVTDVKNYKSNKSFYSQPAPLPSQGTKRFSDSPSLRPWPPMYKLNTKSNINGSHQYLPLSTSGKFNFGNSGFYGNSNGSVYGRNKFNFHGLDRHNNKYSSSVNLTNIKNAKNYYLVSQPYMKNSLVLPSVPFYGRDENLLMVDKDGQHNEKGRFRKLRNPTQTPPLRSCACIRSKSMEDVRTEIVTDWTAQNIKEGFNHLGRTTRITNGLNKLNGKNNVRRSMDNLLEVETAYGKPFQVGLFDKKDLSDYQFLINLLINVYHYANACNELSEIFDKINK